MVQKTDARGAWETVDIAGHPASVFEPPKPHPHGYVVLYLHAVGCEDVAEDQVFTSLFAQHGLRAVAPHTGESWWCDRLFDEFDAERTAERYVVEDVLPAIADRWQVGPPRVGVTGISMGGQGALRLAYKYPGKFPVAAAISPAIDFHLWLERPTEQVSIVPALRKLYRDAEDARQDTATLHIHPLNWPPQQWFATDPADHWHEGADRLAMKLSSLGIPHQRDLETTAGGHSWDYFHAMAPKAVEFLVSGLERERLRLPV